MKMTEINIDFHLKKYKVLIAKFKLVLLFTNET